MRTSISQILNNEAENKKGPKGKNNFFTREEWSFIKEISARFHERTPSILERFTRASWCDAGLRPMLALLLLKDEPRRGLMQRGYAQEDVETVYEHSRNMSRLLGRIFKDNSDLKEKYPGNKARKILVHDLGEALTTDFTPQDMKRISAKEKIALEDLAMRLIFETDVMRYDAYISYKNKETIDDDLIKVIDTLEFLEDIRKSGVRSEIHEEVRLSTGPVLEKYRDIFKDLGVEPSLMIRPN